MPVLLFLIFTAAYGAWAEIDPPKTHESPSQKLAVRSSSSLEQQWLRKFQLEASSSTAALRRYDDWMTEFNTHRKLETMTGRMERESAIRFLNEVFVEISILRLSEELAAIKVQLEQSFSKPWMKEAEEKRLTEKSRALAEIQTVRAQLRQVQLPEPALDWIHLIEMIAAAEKRKLNKMNDNGLSEKTLKNLAASQKKVNQALDKLNASPTSAFRTSEHAAVLNTLPEIMKLAAEYSDSASGHALQQAIAKLQALDRQTVRARQLNKIVDEELLSNPERVAEAKTFLKKIGSDTQAQVADSIDLSQQFPPPQSQGELLSCVAHALVSDMSTHLEEGEAPSPNYAYALMAWAQFLFDDELSPEKLTSGEVSSEQISRVTEALSEPSNFPENMREVWRKLASAQADEGPLYSFANRGILFELAQAVASKNALASEKSYPSTSNDFIPQSLNKIADRRVVLEAIQRLRHPMTEAEMKQALSSQKPFQIVIATDARYIREDWVLPDPHNGSIPHVFNVVGYGRGNDPNDNREKLYFKIRDSFTPGEYHYKISSDVLIPLSVEALRVTKVGKSNASARYERVELP